MNQETANISEGATLTEEGKLRRENIYLKARISNLETFKSLFFTLKNELSSAEDKISTIEQQLSTTKLKSRILNPSEDAINDEQTDNVLAFVKDCTVSASYQDLIISIFQSIDGIDIDMAIQINNKNNALNFSLEETNKKEQIDIIEKYKNKGSLVELDDMLIFNYSGISILVKITSNKKQAISSLKDYIEVIAMSANTRIEQLIKSEQFDESKRTIYKIFKQTNQSFKEMQNSSHEQIIKISDLQIKLEKDLKHKLSRMNISAEYMSIIESTMNDARNELNLNLTSSLTQDHSFLKTMKQLEDAYSKEYSK